MDIIYTLNGEELPTAISFLRSELLEGSSLFPHVLSRNYAFEVNFGSNEEPWFASPQNLSDYEFIDNVENKILGSVRPENRNDCQVCI